MKDGFLSASLDLDELQSVNDSICIMTCFSGTDLCGYHVASTPEFNENSPLLMAMMQQFGQIAYKGKTIAEYDCFIAGPTCIDKKYRGQGIYPRLITALFDFLRNTLDPSRLRISFASKANPRSLNTQKKIGCEIIGEFQFNANEFFILCLDLEEINKFQC
ncbi:GNAT family protein [uncultured Thiodictyon sp.]|uniref:GNAT family N-acetyltransferase n=1 Tax=uncultured Thiodictyon sp. TaxID=1846217 RepID=UPI0025FEDA60|nr:GNAT family protein [uncultured Thiodictyon sp.]